jgi:hypothetical protein
MAARPEPIRFCLGAALLLAGCAAVPAPESRPTAKTVPDSVEAIFHTDPTTGATDGPFDPTTGLRLMTHTDAAGVMHVLLDPVSKRPVLLTGPDRS